MQRMTAPVLLWFRHDLRLADNPALIAVAGRPVLPVFLLDEISAGPWAPGGATQWWLHHSLERLGASLAALGAPLLLARGRAESTIPALAAAIGATEVLAARRYEPWAREADRRTAEALASNDSKLRLFSGTLLHEPHRIATGAGKPYGVFTPFSKAVLAQVEIAAPLPAPTHLQGLAAPPVGDKLADWRLLPSKPDWAGGLRATWQPGEVGAAALLARFAAGPAAQYGAARNDPSAPGTSTLSPHLALGELSPRQVWHAVPGAAAEPFRRQLLWREFSYHQLWHRPELPESALRPAYNAFPWAPNPALLRAWQQGRTGYPLVDAGMRQLWQTGWMHNRVRMVVASFLVKHLLQPWQDGANWFWDTLVDADLANNSASWQWVAGCGSDAAPYFRVFNPVLQGEKFDPAGAYVSRWLPELARLPANAIHRPWEAPDLILRGAGVRLGQTYPAPVVDHAMARARALAAFAALPKSAAGALEEPLP